MSKNKQNVFHHFDTRLAKELGIASALIIQNLAYWSFHKMRKGDVDDQGVAWVYNTIKEWGAVYDYLSKDTLRRNLERLEAKGIIRSAKLNARKQDQTKWYSIRDKAYLISYKSKNDGGLTTEKPEKKRPKSSDSPFMQNANSSFMQNANSYKETIVDTIVDTDTKLASASPHPDNKVAEMKLKKIPNKKEPKYPTFKKGMTVDDILNSPQKKKPKPKEVKVYHLASVWLDGCKKYHGLDTLPKLTHTSQAQLKLFLNTFPQEDVSQALQTILEGWGEFVLTAGKEEGAYPLPTKPNIGFLSKYRQTALSYVSAMENKKLAKIPHKEKILSHHVDTVGNNAIVGKVQSTAPDKLSKDQVLAILNDG